MRLPRYVSGDAAAPDGGRADEEEEDDEGGGGGGASAAMAATGLLGLERERWGKEMEMEKP